jgi:hypothetical protein
MPYMLIDDPKRMKDRKARPDPKVM